MRFNVNFVSSKHKYPANVQDLNKDMKFDNYKIKNMKIILNLDFDCEEKIDIEIKLDDNEKKDLISFINENKYENSFNIINLKT